MAHAGGQQAEADNPVSDHHVMQDGHFFAQQLVALALDHEEFEASFEGRFKLRGVPRFGNIFVNRAGIYGGDGGIHIRVSCGQHPNDARLQLARFFEKPDAFFSGHPLVGHQQADFVLMSIEKLESVLSVRRGQDIELIGKSAREIFQRLLFVIHVENLEFLIVVKVFHRMLLSVHVSLLWETPA